MNYKELVTELNLRILHDCLTSEGAQEILGNQSLAIFLNAQYEGITLRKRVEELASIENCISSVYIKKLEELRIVLLGS